MFIVRGKKPKRIEVYTRRTGDSGCLSCSYALGFRCKYWNDRQGVGNSLCFLVISDMTSAGEIFLPWGKKKLSRILHQGRCKNTEENLNLRQRESFGDNVETQTESKDVWMKISQHYQHSWRNETGSEKEGCLVWGFFYFFDLGP